MTADRTIFVVDDDPSLRESVGALLSSMGYSCQGFASAEEFLAHHSPCKRGILVADLRMPGMNGLQLQEELARRNIRIPVIVLTAYARTATTVQAMQAGAVTTIDKPYHDDELWDAVRIALAREEADWIRQQQHHSIRDRLKTLTLEERLVLDLLLEGKPNKSIAQELDFSLRTVEKRRHDVFAKMMVGSIAELVGLVHEMRQTE